MTDEERRGPRIVGSLRAADGEGVVRMEDRFDTGIDDLWSALTDPGRLARWLGEVGGELRIGGELRLHYYASGWEGTGRIEVCEPPRRLRIRTAESGSSDSHVTEVTLTEDGGSTMLVLEEGGVPLDNLAGYGAGTQVHIDDLAAYLRGSERHDARVRIEELYPAYRTLADRVG